MATPSTHKTPEAPAYRAVPKMPFTCTTCRWWVPGRTLSNLQAMPGQCRRNPPVPVAGGNRWPATDGHEWCGEHSRLEEEMQPWVKMTGDDALGRLARQLDLEQQAGTPAAGHPGEKPEAAAAPSTGGAEPDGGGNSPRAEAGQPKVPKPAAFAPSARRR